MDPKCPSYTFKNLSGTPLTRQGAVETISAHIAANDFGKGKKYNNKAAAERALASHQGKGM